MVASAARHRRGLTGGRRPRKRRGGTCLRRQAIRQSGSVRPAGAAPARLQTPCQRRKMLVKPYGQLGLRLIGLGLHLRERRGSGRVKKSRLPAGQPRVRVMTGAYAGTQTHMQPPPQPPPDVRQHPHLLLKVRRHALQRGQHRFDVLRSRAAPAQGGLALRAPPPPPDPSQPRRGHPATPGPRAGPAELSGAPHDTALTCTNAAPVHSA